MSTKRTRKAGKFDLGQIVWNDGFSYRGVIYDVDPEFMLPDEVYERISDAAPDRNQPWYKVLVDGTDQQAYVAEQHLRAAREAEPIEHEAIDQLFDGFEGGRYHLGIARH